MRKGKSIIQSNKQLIYAHICPNMAKICVVKNSDTTVPIKGEYP